MYQKNNYDIPVRSQIIYNIIGVVFKIIKQAIGVKDGGTRYNKYNILLYKNTFVISNVSFRLC